MARRVRILLRTILFLALLNATASGLFSQSADEAYQRGIQLLYQAGRPQEALAQFRAAHALDPAPWSRAFMIGYTLKQYLSRPEEALAYFEEAWRRNSELNELPYKETILCLEQLQRFPEAIERNRSAQAALRTAGKPIPPWFAENIAFLHFQSGDLESARRLAPSGGWTAAQLAPRIIEIDWNLRFVQLLQAWRIDTVDRVRLTLPIERDYQILKSVRVQVSGGPGVRTRRLSARGNSFLELQRTGGRWPERVRLRLNVEQRVVRSISTRPAGLAAAHPGDPVHAWASENKNGLFSLENAAFRARIREITGAGATSGEKAELALRWLRANFRYGEKPEGGAVADWLEYGSGDCGYYTFIAIAMLRALDIPVRGVYGLNPWSDPAPALPHSIIEIYDVSTGRWFPHDPQSDALYGVINPAYVAFTAGNPAQDAAVRAPDGVWELDTVWFFWEGSGRDTLAYTVRSAGASTVASRSADLAPENYSAPASAAGPPPAR